MKIKGRSDKGFTLIELLVVVSIISLLTSIVLASLSSAKGKAADALRVSEVHQLQNALDIYYNTHGQYPGPSGDSGACVWGGWDTTCDGSFLTALSADGLFTSALKDPKDAAGGNYLYYRYGAGYAGCPASSGAFYVIEVAKTDIYGAVRAPYSPGFSCSGRDWGSEGSYVVGKFEQQ